MAKVNFKAKSATVALSTAKTIIEVSRQSDGESIPDDCELSLVHMKLDTIAGGATTVTWNVCPDAAGDYNMTLEKATTIVTGATTPGSGGVAETLGVERNFDDDIDVTGKIYVVARLDAGTANAVVYISGNKLDQ